MNAEQYRKLINDLEMLISVGTRVSQNLVSTNPVEEHLKYADPIFSKLLAHAISLKTLSPQIEKRHSIQFWDMPSACAVARCIIEAHDVLEYIAFADLPQDEIQFRLLVWKTHDQQRRSKMLKLINSTDPQALEIHKRAESLTKQALEHPLFDKLNKDWKRKIRNGDAPSFLLSQKEQNVINGVNHEYHVAATMHLSQHIHTFPFSVNQLIEFRAGTPEALGLCSMPIQYSLAFLARAISCMVEKFPHGDAEIRESEFRVFELWIELAETGVAKLPQENALS